MLLNRYDILSFFVLLGIMTVEGSGSAAAGANEPPPLSYPRDGDKCYRPGPRLPKLRAHLDKTPAKSLLKTADTPHRDRRVSYKSHVYAEGTTRRYDHRTDFSERLGYHPDHAFIKKASRSRRDSMTTRREAKRYMNKRRERLVSPFAKGGRPKPATAFHSAEIWETWLAETPDAFFDARDDQSNGESNKPRSATVSAPPSPAPIPMLDDISEAERLGFTPDAPPAREPAPVTDAGSAGFGRNFKSEAPAAARASIDSDRPGRAKFREPQRKASSDGRSRRKRGKTPHPRERRRPRRKRREKASRGKKPSRGTR